MKIGIFAKFTKALLASTLVVGLAAQAAPKKVLVVSVTTGFRHSSIEVAERVIAKLGQDSGAFTVDYARVTPPKGPRKPNAPKESGDADKDKAAKEKYDADLAKFQADDAKFKEAQKSYAAEQKKVLAEKMSPAALKNYDAVIFANTTGDLPLPDNQAFIDWVTTGHGFVAIHSGSDTFHGFKPYVEMLGGEFKTHGAQVTVTAINKDPNHPATKHLPAQWEIFDEIYEFKSHDQGNIKELLSMDKHPQNKAPGYNGMSWYRNVGKGRVFYTSLGHREDMWDPEWKEGGRKNPPAIAMAYQQHVLGGIKWALGLDAAVVLASSAATVGESGFVPLFNGKDTTGWKLRRPDGHNSWTIENGILKNTVKTGEHGTDLVTEKKYWNFTVRYEYQVPDNSNSGFYLRGRHEIQILGDFKAGKTAQGGNGAIYNRTAPSEFASKPGGEWQTVEATIIDNKITVVLNGKKIHDNVVCDVATGSEIDGKVKEPGPIFLQGDHGTVWFRNMSIKELPKS